MTLDALAREMKATHVLGAGRIGEAVDVVSEMFHDRSFTNFLTIAGPMVPAGFRLLFGDLIDRGFLDAIVTTGANLTHDVIESLGLHHYQGSFQVDDRKLIQRGYSRIADIFVKESSFERLDITVRKLLRKIPVADRRNFAFSDLLFRLGGMIKDRDSILHKAASRNVKIFSPGLLDSILGLSLWSFAQTETLQLNPFSDVTKMVNMAVGADKIGVLILGGGVPKHHTLLASVLREGVDRAVQITSDRPEPGGLSGAPLSESISWRKIRKGGKFVDIYGDATICLPLIIGAVLDRVKKRDRRLVE
ncbi:deoxyhypusine synthase [Candidatus Bathyarchaeota archaeon]|nr:MAG: deoxyhypusine synthase [Candidatus Bathyarchaeota archaeon]